MCRNSGQVGVVVIGRNEGERLRACLQSVAGSAPHVVYVDSGSTDDSVDTARSMDVSIVELDSSVRFTAGRARNEGLARLLMLAPGLEFVQFVDGDCELADDWIPRARGGLEAQSDVAVACGRNRERFPDRSIYNRLCDIEWDTPVGEARSCGGNALMRVAALRDAGGFREDLLAGEEPELCVRLIQSRWRILRLDAEMTTHDADMLRFGQWWSRTMRSGHAYAAGRWLHGRGPSRHYVVETNRIAFWGLGVPLLAVGAAWPTNGASLWLLLAYPVQFLWILLQPETRRRPPRIAVLYSFSCVLGKLPQLLGALRFAGRRLQLLRDHVDPDRHAPPAGRRARRWRLALFLGALMVVGAEVTTRLLVETADNGMPVFRRWPLLPFLPTEKIVREHLATSSRATYIVPDHELGWTLGRGATAGAGMATNHQGFRGDPDRTFPVEPASGRFRLVVCGDSFTHGDELVLEDTWAWQLEQLGNGLEVVNLGVPAYGTDQAFLRWRRDGRPLRAHAVALAIWPENICRNLNLVRYYLQPAGGYLSKPRFTLQQGGLELLNSPVLAGEDLVKLLSTPEEHSLLDHERWYRPSSSTDSLLYASRFLSLMTSLLELRDRREERSRLYSGEDREGIDVTTAIARRFREEVAATGAQPLVIVFPMRDLLQTYPGENDLPLVRDLRANGLEVIDLFPAFAALPAEHEALFRPSGHLSVRGNALVADVLFSALDSHFDSTPGP